MWSRISLRPSALRFLQIRRTEQPDGLRSFFLCKASRSGRYRWGSWSISTRLNPSLVPWSGSRTGHNDGMASAELDVSTWNCKESEEHRRWIKTLQRNVPLKSDRFFTWVHLSVPGCTWVYLGAPECTWECLKPATNMISSPSSAVCGSISTVTSVPAGGSRRRRRTDVQPQCIPSSNTREGRTRLITSSTASAGTEDRDRVLLIFIGLEPEQFSLTNWCCVP